MSAAMKDAKKSALKMLIKSMNKKRMDSHKKPTPVEALNGEGEETPEEEMDEYADGDSEMEGGEEMHDADDGQDSKIEDMVKGFMKHGRSSPSAKKPTASLTVVMAGMGKKRK